MKQIILLAIGILMLGCQVHQSPDGHGSSTLKNWIELNIEKDKLEKRKKEINLKLFGLK